MSMEVNTVTLERDMNGLHVAFSKHYFNFMLDES